MTEHAENAAEEIAPDSAPEAAAEMPEIDALRADCQKFKDLYLRSQADLDNYRKRAAREVEDARRYANSALLERLLPVLDNFELGLEAAKNTAGAESILQGMGMVQKQLQDFLRESGVESIEAVGQPFDPNLHEALGQEASADVPEGAVVRQMRRGYKLKDRLLRASAVMVSKGSAAE